jgi:hypothetical protein
MWVLPDEAALPADTNWLLQKHREKHCKEKFSIPSILYGDQIINQCIKAQHIHHVLCMLFGSPEFSDY